MQPELPAEALATMSFADYRDKLISHSPLDKQHIVRVLRLLHKYNSDEVGRPPTSALALALTLTGDLLTYPIAPSSAESRVFICPQIT